MNRFLLVTHRYELSPADLIEVALLRMNGKPQSKSYVCMGCGTHILGVSFDTGMGPGWAPAANVLKKWFHDKKPIEV